MRRGMKRQALRGALAFGIPVLLVFAASAVHAAVTGQAQSYYFLRDQEDRATSFLAEEWQQVTHWWRRIEASRSERLAYLESLK